MNLLSICWLGYSYNYIFQPLLLKSSHDVLQYSPLIFSFEPQTNSACCSSAKPSALVVQLNYVLSTSWLLYKHCIHRIHISATYSESLLHVLTADIYMDKQLIESGVSSASLNGNDLMTNLLTARSAFSENLQNSPLHHYSQGICSDLCHSSLHLQFQCHDICYHHVSLCHPSSTSTAVSTVKVVDAPVATDLLLDVGGSLSVWGASFNFSCVFFISL